MIVCFRFILQSTLLINRFGSVVYSSLLGIFFIYFKEILKYAMVKIKKNYVFVITSKIWDK